MVRSRGNLQRDVAVLESEKKSGVISAGGLKNLALSKAKLNILKQTGGTDISDSGKTVFKKVPFRTVGGKKLIPIATSDISKGITTVRGVRVSPGVAARVNQINREERARNIKIQSFLSPKDPFGERKNGFSSFTPVPLTPKEKFLIAEEKTSKKLGEKFPKVFGSKDSILSTQQLGEERGSKIRLAEKQKRIILMRAAGGRGTTETELQQGKFKKSFLEKIATNDDFISYEAGVKDAIRTRPITQGTLFVVSMLLSGGTSYLAKSGAIGRAALKYPKLAKMARKAPKGIALIYGGAKTVEVYSQPTRDMKARKLGSISTEVLSMYLGSAVGSKIGGRIDTSKRPSFAKKRLEVSKRSNKIIRKNKIENGEKFEEVSVKKIKNMKKAKFKTGDEITIGKSDLLKGNVPKTPKGKRWQLNFESSDIPTKTSSGTQMFLKQKYSYFKLVNKNTPLNAIEKRLLGSVGGKQLKIPKERLIALRKATAKIPKRTIKVPKGIKVSKIKKVKIPKKVKVPKKVKIRVPVKKVKVKVPKKAKLKTVTIRKQLDFSKANKIKLKKALSKNSKADLVKVAKKLGVIKRGVPKKATIIKNLLILIPNLSSAQLRALANSLKTGNITGAATRTKTRTAIRTKTKTATRTSTKTKTKTKTSTKSASASKSKSKSASASKSKSKSASASKSKSKSASKSAIASAMASASATKSKIDSLQKQASKSKTKSKQQQLQTQIQNQKQKLKDKQKTLLFLTGISIPGTRKPSVDPDPRKPGDPPPPKFPFFIPGLPSMKGKKGKYDVYMFERNKRVKANKKPLTFKEATRLGMDIADNTVSASFRVIKSGSKAPRAKRSVLAKGKKVSRSKFRKAKSTKRRGFSVEKRRHRIDTGGEKKGLTAAQYIRVLRKKAKARSKVKRKVIKKAKRKISSAQRKVLLKRLAKARKVRKANLKRRSKK
jgi:hypothetical protein